MAASHGDPQQPAVPAAADAIRGFAERSRAVTRHPHPGGEYLRICQDIAQSPAELRAPALRKHFHTALPAVPDGSLPRAFARSLELTRSVAAHERGSLLAHLGERVGALPVQALLPHVRALVGAIARCPISAQGPALRVLTRVLTRVLEASANSAQHHEVLEQLRNMLAQRARIDDGSAAIGEARVALPHVLDAAIAQYPRADHELSAQYFALCREFIERLPAGERPARLKALRPLALSLPESERRLALGALQADYRAATGREDLVLAFYLQTSSVARKKTSPKTVKT